MPYIQSSTTILDANVNGGVAIDLHAKSLTYDVEVFADAPDASHANFTDAFANRLTEGRYMGFGNPTMTLRGELSIAEASPNTVTFTLLHNLAASSAEKTLVDDMTGTITVLVKSISIEKSVTTNGLVPYTMKLIRVKA